MMPPTVRNTPPGGGTSKPSPARELSRPARRPKAAAKHPAATHSNGSDGLKAALQAVVAEEEQAIMDRVKKLETLKEAIAAL
jgi:hypothetical protein